MLVKITEDLVKLVITKPEELKMKYLLKLWLVVKIMIKL